MIQAPLLKPIETPKAKEPKTENVSNNKKAHEAKASKVSKDSKESKEKTEFAKELETSVSKNEAKVKPVVVSEEEALALPSTLVQPEGTTETAIQKIFDPELTKGVEKLIGPKTTEAELPMIDGEILELGEVQAQTEAPVLDGEFAEAMLKNSQGKGRAPAIEFAKEEIDPQLLNNEDFVAQKNLANKKVVTNAYGMKAAPQNQKLALENGLDQTQIIKEANGAENAPMNSQQFILGLNAESKGASVNETQNAPKVFDMNNIKSSDTNEVINQITDYVVQAKAAKEPTVNMRVNHEQLGMIDITVSKSGANHEAIAVNIGAHSLDGKNFFQQNSKELFTHLSNAGLSVSDLKVETPSQTAKNDFDFGSQSGRNQHGDKQFGSEQNQRRHESDRRQDLWKLLNQEAA